MFCGKQTTKRRQFVVNNTIARVNACAQYGLLNCKIHESLISGVIKYAPRSAFWQNCKPNKTQHNLQTLW